MPSAELAEIFCKEGCKDVGNSDNIEEAFHMAHEAKGEDGMLFCVGSLYLVGEIKTTLVEKVNCLQKKRKHGISGLIFRGVCGGIFMIDYEEELKKFEPCLDVTDAEEAIYDRELTDILDILQEMLRESKSGRRMK